MANQLSTERRAQILTMLVEGNSLRSVSRMAKVSINTVSKLLVDAGNACAQFHDENVVNVSSQRIQCDEIWSYVYAKEKNVPEEKKGEAGDVWTWTAIDADTKLIVSYMVGGRDLNAATMFMRDLKSRVNGRIQLTTDGLKAYADAVHVFGGNIDYARLIKIYTWRGAATKNGKPSVTHSEYRKRSARYSPSECVGIQLEILEGEPIKEHISTSFVERNNLTMRMHMRRFTRLTNGFSKKVENHCHAIALHFVYYNFCKVHKTLRTTPAIESGITTDLWTVKNIVELIDKA